MDRNIYQQNIMAKPFTKTADKNETCWVKIENGIRPISPSKDALPQRHMQNFSLQRTSLAKPDKWLHI